MADKLTTEQILAFTGDETPGSTRRYPWHEWVDGSWWLVRQGTDYVVSTESMRRAITMHGKRKCVPVEVYRRGEALAFRFHFGPPETGARTLKRVKPGAEYVTAQDLDEMVPVSRLGDHEGWESRMYGWYGLTRTDTAAECPRVVAGKQCRSHWGECVCQIGGGMSVHDHRAMWKDADGRRVYTSEPYASSLWLEDFDEYREGLAELGLRLTVGAASPWYPLSTVLLMVRQSGA